MSGRKRGQAPAPASRPPMSSLPPASVPPLTSMPPTARESAEMAAGGAGPALHAYMVQRHRMTVGSPLTFSDGEQVIAVLSSSAVPGLMSDIDVIMLVELP